MADSYNFRDINQEFGLFKSIESQNSSSKNLRVEENKEDNDNDNNIKIFERYLDFGIKYRWSSTENQD